MDTDMNFENKLEAAKELLAKTGMRKSSYDPCTFVLLRKIGLKVPPPHFAGFFLNFLIMTVLGFLILFFLWLFGLPPLGSDFTSLESALILSTGWGFIFGLIIALFYRYRTYKYSIPKWKEFSPHERPANNN